MGKKYLFLANYPDEKTRIDKVAFNFMKNAFLTDSVLFFMMDIKREALDYFRWLSRNVFFGSVKMQVMIREHSNPEQVIKQMDYYIVGNHPDELPYLDAAIRNDKEIIGTIEKPEDIFNDIPVTEQVAYLRSQLKNLVENDLMRKFPPQEYEYFLFHEGLGESMALFFWMKEYRKKHDKKILMLCVHPLREEMMRNCPYVDAVVKVPPQIFDYLAIYLADQYNMKKVLTAHFSTKTIKTKQKLQPWELKTYGIPGTIRDFLGINPKIKFEPYPVKLPESAIAKATEIFQSMNLTRGKTILIVTEGYAFSGLQHHNDFWARFANYMSDKGYEVLTNGNKEEIPGCRNVFMSLFETTAFAGMCGHIVSCPTGFVEALCTFNTADKMTLQVIFPGNHDIYWRRPNFINLVAYIESNRYFGRKSADNAVNEYLYQVNQYISPNTDFSVLKWGDNIDEDNLLIEQIAKKIIGSD